MRRFLKKCDIIVFKKNCGNSRPCLRCLNYMKSAGIRRIYYSFDREIKMERACTMETTHISSKFRKAWSLQKSENNTKQKKKITR